jgi:succinate dehydrogenase / fumarate reductase cytochrome b subunit
VGAAAGNVFDTKPAGGLQRVRNSTRGATVLTQSSGQAAGPVAREAPGNRFWLLDFYSTAVGKKAVMAVTGIILLGFVLVHMLGNLKLYYPDAELHLNEYGAWLRTIGEPALPHTGFLWILRVVLIISFVLHIHAATTLTLMNRRARPVKYQGGYSFAAADYANRTMRWSGVIVGLFLIFHLMDMTWGWHVVHQDFVEGQPYRNLWHSFSPERWPVSIVYIVANIALGLHIYHGAWSLFQSLGWANPRFNSWRRGFAGAFAAVIVIGNVSFPIAVLSGLIDEPVQPTNETAMSITVDQPPLVMSELVLPAHTAKGI